MSHKRGPSPALGAGRKTDRHRNSSQAQHRAPPPTRQRPVEPVHYVSQGAYDFNYEQSSQPPPDRWDEFPSSQRQPSAHISELDSTDETYVGSQNQYQSEREYDNMEPDNMIIKAPKVSHQSHRPNHDGRGQTPYDEISVIETRHPSAARLRQAEAVDRSKNREPLVIGKSTGPVPFKAAKPSRTRGHPTNDGMEPNRYQDAQGQEQYDPPTTDRRGFTAPANQPKSYRPTKMDQCTKFDTPSEKGSRPHASNTRSSEMSAPRTRNRRDPTQPETHVSVSRVDYTPTATSKVSRHRGRVVEQDTSFDIDPAFDDPAFDDPAFDDPAFDNPALLFDGPGNDDLDTDFQYKGDHVVPPTPPSDRTLALGHARPIKATTKPKINLSSGLGLGLGSDEFDDDMGMGLLEDVVGETKLKLQMPKTVDQVVKHISTILAKKVAKDQGEIAIKSYESWDWSRLSVLSSEMNSGILEMETAIKGAGENRQGGIEGVKRKRVSLEAEVTAQYEEFRKDFREACEKMQQPARLGKRFKFGPF